MRNDTRRWTVHVAIACIAGIASVSTAASAADGDAGPASPAGLERGLTSSLSWVRLRGAEACIATQALAQSVEKRLGRKVFVSAAEADLSVEGRVERESTGFRALFELRDRSGNLVGTRELKSAGPTCVGLEESLTFVLSVLIEPHLGVTKTPEPEIAAAPSAPPPPSPERVIVRVERERAEPAVSFVGHGSLAVGGGFLPRPGLGVAVAAIVHPRSFWGIVVGGHYWFESDVSAERGATATASSAFGTVGLCPLGHLDERDRVAASLCAGAHVGALRSRGSGFSVSEGDEVFIAYGTVLGHASYRLTGPLALVAGGSLSAPFARGELRYRAADGAQRTLFRASPIAVAAHVGLGVRFP